MSTETAEVRHGCCGQKEWLGVSSSTRASAKKMRDLDRKHAGCREARNEQ